MNTINTYLNLLLKDPVPSDIAFSGLGMANTTKEGTLTFLDDARFLKEVNENTNIAGVMTTSALAPSILNKPTMICEDPRWAFYTLHNHLAKDKTQWSSEISPEASIHPTAFVAQHNVRIGRGTYVGPNATIQEDVTIGEDCIIGAGTVVGCEGFEHKRTSKGILSVIHDGQVLMGDRIELGANNTVAKGFAYRNTIIGNDTKSDSLVYVAHCVQIGERCLLAAHCTILGSVTIHDDVWIGPGVNISSGLTIGQGAYISIGSTVTQSVKEKEKMTGYFAIPHDRFLTLFKKSIKE